jgi:hypothetical protein
MNEHAPSGFGVAEVTIENDVDHELGLDKIPFSMRIMMGLAQRGGEAPYPRTKVVMPNGTILELQHSIEKLESLGLVEAFTPGVLVAKHDFAAAMLRLTDKGKTVCAAYENKKIKVGAVKNIPIGQVIADAKKALQ